MAPLANAKSPTARRVYSYIRFSTPEQKHGDSKNRQDSDAKKWADRNGYEFDEKLRDEGLSAFHGHHRKKGALGRFLAAVKAGQVPPGSILAVENIDRLGREGTKDTLQRIIFELWDGNITVQTLSPEEEYPPDCGNQPKFLGLLICLQRAYDESKRKSEMITKSRDTARSNARQEGKILTSRAPAWLTVVDKEFQPIPAASRTIKRIFEVLRGI